MGRKTAIYTLLLLLASYALPAVAGVSASGKPFCCRAIGKHHCGMGEQPHPGRSFQGQRHCPYQAPASFTAHAQSFVPPVSQISAAPSPAAAGTFTLASVFTERIALSDIDQRGPPVLSL